MNNHLKGGEDTMLKMKRRYGAGGRGRGRSRVRLEKRHIRQECRCVIGQRQIPRSGRSANLVSDTPLGNFLHLLKIFVGQCDTSTSDERAAVSCGLLPHRLAKSSSAAAADAPMNGSSDFSEYCLCSWLVLLVVQTWPCVFKTIRPLDEWHPEPRNRPALVFIVGLSVRRLCAASWSGGAR